MCQRSPETSAGHHSGDSGLSKEDPYGRLDNPQGSGRVDWMAPRKNGGRLGIPWGTMEISCRFHGIFNEIYWDLIPVEVLKTSTMSSFALLITNQ